MYRDLYAKTSPTVERTFVLINPDGVRRGFVATIMSRFEERGYKLIALKMLHPSKDHLKVWFERFLSF
jgi:nucleoside-diphosphate kinase